MKKLLVLLITTLILSSNLVLADDLGEKNLGCSANPLENKVDTKGLIINQESNATVSTDEDISFDQ